ISVTVFIINNISIERVQNRLYLTKLQKNFTLIVMLQLTGNVGVSELVGGLVEAIERFGSQRDEDVRVERERQARQRVKMEQDEAAKEEFKKQQEFEKNQELERAESERMMEEAKKEGLLDYLASKGYPKENYKVISSWPRRDLTTESLSSTLKALKLYPQETIVLEER
ncbi:unnamed protein product, partial [Leptidea sinapis]